MLVADVMRRGTLAVDEQAPLSDAIATFARHDVGGLAVLGAGGRVVGVISRTDITDRLAAKETLEVDVGEAMSAPALTVRETDSLESAISSMVMEGMHRAVVVDERGEPTGMITPWDVARAIADRRLPC